MRSNPGSVVTLIGVLLLLCALLTWVFVGWLVPAVLALIGVPILIGGIALTISARA